MISQKTLKFYVYIDGENDIPFYGASYEDFIDKNGEVFTTADGFVFNVRQLNEQLEISSFRYDAKRMGGAPSISCTLMYPSCLDDFWSDAVYVVFNDERFFLKQTPTSSKNNEDARYKHELELVSERMILDNTYYFDAVVGEPLENDKPVTNSTKFFFVGKIEDFVKKINASLQYTKLQKVNEDGSISGYHVVLDEGMVSEDKQVSFDNAVISQALQECYNTFGIPFYFDGKTIHVGFTNNAISDVLEYGVDNQLLSITKTNSNFKVVNRASGTGSSENIPYFYPNNSPKGEIEAVSSNPDLEVTIEDYEKFSNEVRLDESIRYGTTQDIVFVSEEESKSEYDKQYYHIKSTSSAHISIGAPSIVNITFLPDDHSYMNVRGQKKDLGERLFKDNAIDSKIVTSSMVNIYKDGVLLDIKELGGESLSNQFKNIRDLKTPITIDLFASQSCDVKMELFLTVNPIAAIPNGWKYRDSYYVGECVWSVNTMPVDRELWLKDDKEVNLEDIGLVCVGDPIFGDTITQKLVKRVQTSNTLQPSIYRATDGKERFYNAINYPFEYKEGYELQYGEYVLDGQVHNDVYKKDDGTYYEFVTPYVEGHPREHVFTVDDIKPTIKEMTNDESWTVLDEEYNEKVIYQRVDMFAEFAYDEGDSDETYNDGDKVLFKHPYFFAKLRRLPFNLFEHASENGEMTFSMTSGNCGSCNFVLGVSEDEPQYNTVQVYESDTWVDGVFHPKGSLVRDEDGRVLCGIEGYQDKVPMQPIQQDTVNNEVWIALKKEESTYGILMPKAPVYNENGTIKEAGSRPIACSSWDNNDGDTFVILNITLPDEYIYKAEKKLEKAIIKYIWENNEEKFNFSVDFSRIFLEENPNFFAQLNENARINVRYNGCDYLLYVSSFSYQMSDGDILPKITIELDDTLTISQNALQQAIDGVKAEIGDAISALDAVALGGRYFLRKDVDDTSEGRPYFKRGVSFGQGGEVNIYEDGSAKLSIDYLEVTKKATFTSLEIQEKHHVGGQILISPASMTCSDIAEVRDENNNIVAWRCYMQTKGESGEETFNTFAVDDQAICQTFNEWGSKYYWRLVTGVGEDYIDLSVEDCDEESDIPSIGDKIIQLGNRTNTSRQAAQVLSAHGENAPSFIMYNGIDSFSLEGKDITGVTWNPEKQEPKMYSYGDFFFGDKNREKDFIAFENKEGEDNKTLRVSANVSIEEGSVMASRLDVGNPQDGNVEAFLNGGEFAKDDSERDCGKLILAAGIPKGDASELEERAKQANTRIYEDGCIYSNNLHLQDGCTIGDLDIRYGSIVVGEPKDYDFTKAVILSSDGLRTEGKTIITRRDELIRIGDACGYYSMDIDIGGSRVCYVYDKEVGLHLNTPEAYSILSRAGQFAGLRPKTRVIKVTGYPTDPHSLTDLDHTIIVNVESGMTYLNVPPQPQEGQRYEIYTCHANMDLCIYFNEVNVYSFPEARNYNGADAVFEANQRRHIVLIYAENQWWMDYRYLNA